MAFGPQHIGKNMGTENSFDLNKASHQWREELAQHGIAPAEAKELESHLLESMDDLRQRGLNDEEAFWVARHRLGTAPELADHFANADPGRVWKERIFWAAALMLAVSLWTHLQVFSTNWLADLMGQSALLWSVLASEVLTLLPVVVVAALLARGHLQDVCNNLSKTFRSRRQFARVTAIVVTGFLVYSAARLWSSSHQVITYATGVSSHINFWGTFLGNAIWPVTLVLIMLSFASKDEVASAA
jgi:hypothetical protein